jgi:hypothetical protein
MNAIMMMIKRAHTRAKFHPFILLLFLRSHKTIQQQQQQSWRRQAMVEWYSCGNPMRMGTFNASRIFKVISVVVFIVAKSMTRPQVAPCDEWIKIKNAKERNKPARYRPMPKRTATYAKRSFQCICFCYW